MSPLPKRKLCWQCEGSVAFQDDNCPYCGVYLHPEDTADRITSAENPFASFSKESNHTEQIEEDDVGALLSGLSYAKPLLLLLLGTTLIIFSALLYLFGHNGVLTLQWDASIWYVYLVVSMPLIYGGLKALNHLDSDLDEEE